MHITFNQLGLKKCFEVKACLTVREGFKEFGASEQSGVQTSCVVGLNDGYGPSYQSKTGVQTS